MRERRRTNAVSIGLSALLFSIMGCLIGVGSILAGFEPAMVKTGLVIYAFIAGPIFLAGAVERLTDLSDQENLRAKLHVDLGRKCVKPHVGSIGRRTYLAALLAMFVAAGAVATLIRNGLIPGGPIVKWLVVYGAAAAAYFVVVSALKRRYVRLGVLSPDEAESFPSWSRRWTEPGLEPADRDCKDVDKMPGNTQESGSHVVDEKV